MTSGYATASGVHKLSAVFLEIVSSLPYYNDLAKHTEAAKYNPNELLKKLQEDFRSIIVVKEKDQVVAFCFSCFDYYTIWLERFGVWQ